MNSVPYLWVYILFATVTVTSPILSGIAGSLKSAGIPAKRIRRIVLSAGTLLFGWMALCMLLGWMGVFLPGVGGKVPFIAFGMIIPIVIGIWLIRRSATVREILRTVSQSSIVGVQGYRGFGAIFLVLYGQKLLPKVFVLPAGFGDVTVGFAALLAAAIYASGSSSRGWLVAAWNVFGIADFVIAVAAGFSDFSWPLAEIFLRRP